MPLKSYLIFLLLFILSLSFPKQLLAAQEVKIYVYSVVDSGLFNENEVQSKISRLNNEGADLLTESTAYKKFKNPDSLPYINYKIVGEKSLVEPVKPGLSLGTNRPNRPDYQYYLNQINVCDLVDNQGVAQIWFWTHHNGDIEPVESNMSMGNVSRQYWNHSGYGDVSNSERTNDLPICDNTYTLFNYNFERGLGEMLEDHTHQLEHLLNYLDGRYKTPQDQWDQLLFWGNFVGSDISHKIIKPGCGWTHYPPNGESDYDWENTKVVESDCEDWKPDGTGDKKLVSCETWYGGACTDDGGVKFKVWWMQNLPGAGNSLEYKGQKLRNWWEVVSEFDAVLAQETGLYVDEVPETFHPYDTNKDGVVNISDVIGIIRYIFK